MVRRQKPHQVPAKDLCTLSDSEYPDSDSSFGLGSEDWDMASQPFPAAAGPARETASRLPTESRAAACRPEPRLETGPLEDEDKEEDQAAPSPHRTMLRSMHEVPLYWRNADRETSIARADLVKLAQAADPETGVLKLTNLGASLGGPTEEPVVNVRLVKVDTSVSTEVPRGIETLGLHALADLHQQLEEERRAMPGELVVPGRICGLAVPMLVDTGAAVSLASTTLWDKLHRQSPGLSLLSTSCCIRTVSGDRAHVRGRLILELELAGQFYVHQFIVADVAENMILGLDFLRKHQVDCDWGRGVLRFQGSELHVCRRYSIGDGLVRELTISEPCEMSASSHVAVEAQAKPRDLGGLSDWEVVSSARKPMDSLGIFTGSALVDPKRVTIPTPDMNPGSTGVALPMHTLTGHHFLVEGATPLMDDRDTDQQQQFGQVNLATQKSSPDSGKKLRSPCFDPEMRNSDEHEWARYEEDRKEYLERPHTGVPQQLMDSLVDDTP